MLHFHSGSPLDYGKHFYLLLWAREFCESTELKDMTVERLQDKLNADAKHLIEAGLAKTSL